MKVFHRYTFIVGHVEFGDLFGLIEKFLSEQGLHYQKLCYEIHDSPMEKAHRNFTAKDYHVIPRRKDATVSDMWDLVRDFPQFNVPIRENSSLLGGASHILSNMDQFAIPMEDDCPEESIRMIARQFPRPYYVSDILFSYVNVDFFGRFSEPVKHEHERGVWERSRRLGSHITMYKEIMFGSRAARVVMTMDATDGNQVLDAECYAKALSQILGKKYTAETVLYTTQEEAAEIEKRNVDVNPLVTAAKSAFTAQIHRLGENVPFDQRKIMDSNFTLAKSLKKIGKEFGFTRYHYNPAGLHYISKRVSGGHLLTFCIDTPPHWNEMRMYVSLDGFGFSHRFGLEDMYGKSQEHADFLIRTGFEIIRDLEEQYILPICKHYPDTPEWYKIDVM